MDALGMLLVYPNHWIEAVRKIDGGISGPGPVTGEKMQQTPL
jgi:hypothetical protein